MQSTLGHLWTELKIGVSISGITKKYTSECIPVRVHITLIFFVGRQLQLVRHVSTERGGLSNRSPSPCPTLVLNPQDALVDNGLVIEGTEETHDNTNGTALYNEKY